MWARGEESRRLEPFGIGPAAVTRRPYYQVVMPLPQPLQPREVQIGVRSVG